MNAQVPYANSEELGHGSAQVNEVDWLRDIVAESGGNAFVLNIGHDVCR